MKVNNLIKTRRKRKCTLFHCLGATISEHSLNSERSLKISAYEGRSLLGNTFQVIRSNIVEGQSRLVISLRIKEMMMMEGERDGETGHMLKGEKDEGLKGEYSEKASRN